MNLDLPDVRRILVVKLSSLGDVVHAVPSVAVLAKRFPHVPIDWAVEPLAAPLVRALPFVDRTLVIDGPGAFASGWAAFADERTRVRALLSETRWDLAVDLQGLLRSSLLTVWSGARVRVGRGRWPWLHGSVTMYDRERTPHVVENTARVLELLGIDLANIEARAGEAFASLASLLRACGDGLSREHGIRRPFWVLIPDASHEARSIPLDGLRLPRHVTGVVIGGRFPSPAAAARVDLVDLSGRLPLFDAVSLAVVADRVVGADTGPSHLVARLGGAITGVFGPSRPSRVALRGPAAETIGAPCGGCESKRCPRARACTTEALARALHKTQN